MASFSEREAFLSVDVEDVADFRRALGRADAKLRRDFDRPIRRFGATVRDDARARYRGRYRQGTSGRGRRSVAGITSALAFGEVKVTLNRDGSRPWLVGQEWGGYAARFHPGGMPQIRGGGSGVGGTFLWPAKTAAEAVLDREVTKVVDDVIDVLVGLG
ncbi:MAG: hypothetical protein OXP08_03240 [bacterium]|nr:hypothetical protein [bacterium]